MKRERISLDAVFRSETQGAAAAYRGVLMQMERLDSSDWTVDDVRAWLELKISRCTNALKGLRKFDIVTPKARSRVKR